MSAVVNSMTASVVESDQGHSLLEIVTLDRDMLAVKFFAMGSPCEVLFAGAHSAEAYRLGELAAREAWRIERKFSRYRADSVVASIHERRGTRVRVDDETAALLNFAFECYSISDGMFDITSGILRRTWKFDGSNRVPNAEQVARLVPLIGLDKVEWRAPFLRLPREMELDFGGIGKEYAVDRAYDLLAKQSTVPVLINFGGDLRATGAPPDGPWQVGIERPDTDCEANLVLDLTHSALTTSGDSRRFLLRDGVRYSHILNPKTGWPIEHAPRSVTVAASSCTEAGLLSTLAMLHGADAEEFLREQGVRYWLQR